MWTYWIRSKDSLIDALNILRFVKEKEDEKPISTSCIPNCFPTNFVVSHNRSVRLFFVKRFFFLAHKLCKNKIVIKILQHNMYFLYFAPHLQPGCFGLLNNLNIKKICTTFYISFNFLDSQDVQVNIYEIDTLNFFHLCHKLTCCCLEIFNKFTWICLAYLFKENIM